MLENKTNSQLLKDNKKKIHNVVNIQSGFFNRTYIIIHPIAKATS